MSPQQPCVASPVLQMRKLKHMEVMVLAEGHRAHKTQQPQVDLNRLSSVTSCLKDPPPREPTTGPVSVVTTLSEAPKLGALQPLQECLLITATQAGVGKNGRWRLYQECVGVEGEEVVGR